MKFIRLSSLTGILTLLLFSFISTGMIQTGAPADGKYKVDSTKSIVRWTGKKPTGSHSGTLMAKSGEITVTKGMVSGGKLVLDMNSLKVTDIKDPEDNKDLLNHLKDPDFFDVKNYPFASYEITEALINSDKVSYRVKGKMTIKGITNDVACILIFKEEDKKVSVRSNLKIDRTRFGIKYKSKSMFPDLGDKFIYDDMEINVDLISSRIK